MLFSVFFIAFGGFVVGLILSSFFEHAIHKYFLHSTPKILRKIKYVKSMWQGHAISHHGNYAPDEHYTQDDTNEKEVLTFSWYEGPLIVVIATAIAYGIATLTRSLLGIKIVLIMPEVIGACIAFALYYIAYESLHALMHVPKKWKWFRSTSFMLWLNRHHYQHHVDPRTNLNVILPIADYVWDTKRRLPKDQCNIANAVDTQ